MGIQCAALDPVESDPGSTWYFAVTEADLAPDFGSGVQVDPGWRAAAFGSRGDGSCLRGIGVHAYSVAGPQLVTVRSEHGGSITLGFQAEPPTNSSAEHMCWN